jgi:hypothetical protein
MLDQKLSMILQHQWVSKLLGFDFRVEYKVGSTNVVGDTLSRRDIEEVACLSAISTPSFLLFEALCQEFTDDSTLCALRDEVVARSRGDKWKLVDGLVTMDGKVYVPPSPQSLTTRLTVTHRMGHEGITKTLHCLCFDFYVLGAQKVVQDSTMCQKNKTNHLHLRSLLQPLHLPSTMWTNVAMDFIEVFPRVNGM